MISAGERGRPQAVFESNSPESVRNLIAAGLGIGFWPEKAWGGKPGAWCCPDPDPLPELQA